MGLVLKSSSTFLLPLEFTLLVSMGTKREENLCREKGEWRKIVYGLLDWGWKDEAICVQGMRKKSVIYRWDHMFVSAYEKKMEERERGVGFMVMMTKGLIIAMASNRWENARRLRKKRASFLLLFFYYIVELG